MKNILFFAILGTILFTGCTTKIPVDRQVGQLNLDSKKLEQQKSVNHVIAIVSPNSEIKLSNSQKAQNEILQNPLLMMMNRAKLSPKFDFTKEYNTNYVHRLNQALDNSVSNILTSKGFKLKGPYESFDEITYQDKKQVYLAFVPKIEFTIDDKVINTQIEKLYSITDGVIQIGGSVLINIIEPITGQVFVNKRINLSDFNIQEKYTYGVQHSQGDGSLTGMAMDKVLAPSILVDNTDIALTKAINQFYAKTIERINQYLDKEEIIGFEQDVMKLKDLKRY